MNRRLVLASGLLLALALLAGCSSVGSLEMRPVNETELARYASHSVAPSEAAKPRAADAIVRSAIENGSATGEGRRPSVDVEQIYRYDGRFYELSSEVTGTRQAVHVSYEIDYNATESTASGRAVEYERLPAPDRRALDDLLPPRSDRRTEGYDFGVGVTHTPAEFEASVLASDSEYDAVVYEGERYLVDAARTRNVTIERYRYTATEVAESAAAFGDRLKQTYLFELTGLTDAERKVVKSATNDTYYAESDDDEAFRSVVERFRRHKAYKEDEYSGRWIVDYRGQSYWVTLRYDGFVG
ncbi:MULTISPECIES: hypothetical protein [Halorussus]|uniref:hypothetical protein n=1 Tax=Halorussus TaxID=1070314 RepID=UPI0020A0799D|nr:hypothetical protein [Halorussus vallis]USZ77605.1 hypothetical protein NGM07_09770 [Halorussus vallis]